MIVAQVDHALRRYHMLIHQMLLMELRGCLSFGTGREPDAWREVADLRQDLISAHDETCELFQDEEL